MSTTNNLSDLELVSSYKRTSDQKYLAELYARHQHLIFGVCLKYFKNKDDASDAQSEIYELLLKRLPRHNPDNFKPWLYVVVKNYCFEKLRKQSRDYVKKEEAAVMYSEQIFHPDDIEDERLLSMLADCIDKLNEVQKSCIQKFYHGKLDYKSIAENLGISWNKVRSQIQNGRRKLKICMESKDELKS